MQKLATALGRDSDGADPLDRLEDLYPLAPLQQGLLFHALAAPGADVYQIQICWEIRGALDRAAWQAAWQQAVDRHAVLRTAVRWEDLDEPLQLVYRQADLPWETADWQAVPAAEQPQRLG